MSQIIFLLVMRDISVEMDLLEAAAELFCLDTLKEKSDTAYPTTQGHEKSLGWTA